MMGSVIIGFTRTLPCHHIGVQAYAKLVLCIDVVQVWRFSA